MSISLEHIQKAVRKEFPEAVVNGYSKYNKGYVNEVYKLDVSKVDIPLVLKKYSEENFWKVRKEAKIYNLITENTDIPVPKIYVIGEKKEILPFFYLIMSEIPGETLGDVYEKSTDEDKEILAKESGKCLSKLHEIKFSKFGWIDCDYTEGYDNWEDYFNIILFDGIRKSLMQTDMSKNLIHEAIDFFCDKKNLLKIDEHPALIHGDFTLNNINVQGNKISGIFDTEWSFSAHKEYEFVKSKWFMPGGEEFQKFLIEGYLKNGELSSDFEERIKMYEVEKAITMYKLHFDGKCTKEMKRNTDIIKRNIGFD